MRKKELVTRVLMFFCLIQGLASEHLVSYYITPNIDNKNPKLTVELNTSTDKNGELELVYFNEAWGESNLFACLTDLKLDDSSAQLILKPESNKIEILAKPNQSITLSYSIRQDFKGRPVVAEYYRPIINKKYFHLFGHRLFMVPSKFFHSSNKEKIEIKWSKTNFTTHHSLANGNQSSYTINKNELLESVVVGGDFRKTSIEIGGVDFHFLTRGKWRNLSDPLLINKLSSILSIQRAFWDDYEDDHFTVTLLPVSSMGHYELGGTGLTRGFASYCVNADDMNIEALTSLYYHEIMHHWIGGKIRSKTPTFELWFTEGFTEYFAHLLMIEGGDLSIKGFESVSNEMHQSYKSSPVQSITNADIDFASFMRIKEVEQIPYERGFLYARYLDQRMREISNGRWTLKQLMLEILKETAAENSLFCNNYFAEKLESKFGLEERERFNLYILKGELIPYSDKKQIPLFQRDVLGSLSLE